MNTEKKMTWTRRDFLRNSLIGGALVGGGVLAGCGGDGGNGGRKLKLLILGGTGFLGPHTVRAALARGHEMTLFNRGRTNPHLFPDLEKLRGDRDGDLEALRGRDWDAVIDTSGYVPRVVKMSAELLAPRVQQYVFISSISVYGTLADPGIDETTPPATIEDETVEDITAETYGPLKALCEKAAERAMPGRVANIRPGLIVGPGDRSDRFTYWPARVSRGGEVLAPGAGGDYAQFIDVRDLAEWIIHCIERDVTGVYNADSPAASLTIAELLEACRSVSGSDARFVWADEEFLREHEVAAWSDMPVWAGSEEPGWGQVVTRKARGAGLGRRPVSETVRDTLDWYRTLPEERRDNLRSGLKPEREAELLAAWHAAHPKG